LEIYGNHVFQDSTWNGLWKMKWLLWFIFDFISNFNRKLSFSRLKLWQKWDIL
jgi:hypothetical protein